VFMESSKLKERRKTNTRQPYITFKTLCTFILHRVYCFED
jgi:hypothetical protein